MAPRIERKLAAILAADVVGYSRLVEADEAGTIARLKALRKESIEPLIDEHHGRVVKLMGDGALVEFASAVDAVECAVTIQNDVAKREAGVPEDRRLAFRIGINVGDIIAEPGGICVAHNVYNQVKGKLSVALEASGSHQVKNIAEPVETCRVALDGVAVPPAVPRPGIAGQRTRRWLMPAAGVLVAIVVLGGVWHFWPDAPPAEDSPGIAVLPFNNFGGDAATGRLADGITEDIITDLARFRDLDVIARNSTEVYKGKPVDIRQVGKDLNVNYVLEGSIQHQNDQVRVTAQLIGQSGNPWGRPRGATNRRSRQILAEARERGVEPIAVMMDAMEHFLERARNSGDDAQRDALILQAVEVATLAAPYCHPKLRQVEVSGPDGGPIQTMGLMAQLTDEELAERARLKLGRPPLTLIAGPEPARVASDG